MAVSPNTFVVGGGLDQASPAIAVPAGRARSAINYEPLAEGYGSVEGFERYDGRTAPSAMPFHVLDYQAGTSAITAAQVVTGSLSGATGTVLVDPVDVTGSWALGTSAGSLVLVGVAGTFQLGEALIVASVPRATVAAAAVVYGADTEDRLDLWTQEAQTWQREKIGKVPGDGPVRGAFSLNNELYAIRNNALNTNGALYRATSTGWQAVSLGRKLTFTAGLVEIEEGQAVTGATSGASGVVMRVVRQSGDWGSTAAGYIIFASMTGAFQAESIRVGGTPVATVSGDATYNQLPPGGRYQFIARNFFGGSNLFRVYGVNGVGNAFEFGQNHMCPIYTGTPIDTPTHVAEIGNHLALGFRGGSIQTSSDHDPIVFDGELGAAEFGLGADITDFQQATETALAVFGTSKIGILTGTDVETYQFETLTEDAGAEPWTAQRIGQTMYLDRRGLRSLSATASYGNFKTAAMTELVEPLLRAKKKRGAKPVLTYVCKGKSHYRLIWDDGTGIAVYMGRKVPEVLPFETGDMRAFTSWTCEMPDGSEGLFIGAEDGYLYRMDAGTSFDGDAIKGFLMFPFNHLGSPQQNKRFHAVAVEMEATPRTHISLMVQFDYADGEQPADGAQDFFVAGNSGNEFVVQGGGGVWDALVWDDFFWSAPFEGEATAHIDGFGRNASLLVGTRRTVVEPRHILKSYTFFTSPRGMRKGFVK